MAKNPNSERARFRASRKKRENLAAKKKDDWAEKSRRQAMERGLSLQKKKRERTAQHRR